MNSVDFLFETKNIDKRGELISVELTKLTGKEFRRYFIISNIKVESSVSKINFFAKSFGSNL